MAEQDESLKFGYGLERKVGGKIRIMLYFGYSSERKTEKIIKNVVFFFLLPLLSLWSVA
jgi:hypothetical protein